MGPRAPQPDGNTVSPGPRPGGLRGAAAPLLLPGNVSSLFTGASPSFRGAAACPGLRSPPARPVAVQPGSRPRPTGARAAGEARPADPGSSRAQRGGDPARTHSAPGGRSRTSTGSPRGGRAPRPVSSRGLCFPSCGLFPETVSRTNAHPLGGSVKTAAGPELGPKRVERETLQPREGPWEIRASARGGGMRSRSEAPAYSPGNARAEHGREEVSISISNIRVGPEPWAASVLQACSAELSTQRCLRERGLLWTNRFRKCNK